LSNNAMWVAFPVRYPPEAKTLLPTDVTPFGATLNAEVNPNGLSSWAWFEWGHQLEQTTSLFDVSQGTRPIPFRYALSDLTPGLTYQYRVAVSNIAGTTFGSNGTFIASLPPTVE